MDNRIYYIYHIPGVKIGCTDDVPRRMADQFAKEWEILETHTDIFIASDREQELQKQWGYPVDKHPYWKSATFFKREACKRGGLKTKELGYLDSYRTKEHQRLAGRKGGLIGGKRNVETGQIDKAREASIEVSRKEILQFDSKGNFIREWKSLASAARELGLQVTHISRVLRGVRKHTGGWTFTYKNPQ
jgi:hypothetical protein